MARCPECAGKMTYNNMMKQMVCNSCGLSMTRHDLDTSWQKVRSQNYSDSDDKDKARSKRKDWLEWYSSSKEDKNK